MGRLKGGGSRKYRPVTHVEVTLGTRGFSRVRREFSVLAEGRQIFGRRPNCARKVSGTQGM